MILKQIIVVLNDMISHELRMDTLKMMDAIMPVLQIIARNTLLSSDYSKYGLKSSRTDVTRCTFRNNYAEQK